MNELVSNEDLERARSDPEFRQKLLADNLDRLLRALNVMRQTQSGNPQAARQIREGVDLAVKLADRLQQNAGGPRAA